MASFARPPGGRLERDEAQQQPDIFRGDEPVRIKVKATNDSQTTPKLLHLHSEGDHHFIVEVACKYGKHQVDEVVLGYAAIASFARAEVVEAVADDAGELAVLGEGDLVDHGCSLGLEVLFVVLDCWLFMLPWLARPQGQIPEQILQVWV